MFVTVLIRSRTHRFYIKSNVVAGLIVLVFYQHFNLIEGLTQVFNTKGFILIKADSVLIIQMAGEKLVKRQRKAHFIGGIKSCERRVSGFHIGTNAFRVDRCR